jgi:hypothetical protein
MAQEGDPLETLRSRLYATQPTNAVVPEHLVQGAAQSTAAWTPAPQPIIKPHKKHMSLAVWFLIIGAVFFVVAGTAAGLLLAFGGRTVSTTHVTLDVQGPTTIASGDTVPILISVKNDNPVAITGGTMTVTFPDGTHNPDAIDKPLSSYSDSIGDIQPGGHIERTVRAALFGAQNQVIMVPIKIEYHTPGSNATSVKQAQYSVTVTTSPVSVNVSSVSEVASGQSVTVQVRVRSNAVAPLQKIALIGEYPPGFIVTKTDPVPTKGSYFLVGTLAPGQERHALRSEWGPARLPIHDGYREQRRHAVAEFAVYE